VLPRRLELPFEPRYDCHLASLPTGTVTFLFGDVEGSTKLLERLGEGYASELAAHRSIVRDAVAAHSGEIVDQRGEEVFAVFADAAAAVDAAAEVQRLHMGRVMRVRIGLHTGEPSVTGEGYLGLDVHRAARICAAAYGGQVLLSARTRALVAERSAKGLGEYLLRGISVPERLYQLLEPGLYQEFAPLRALPAPEQRGRVPRPTRRTAGRSGLEQLAWETRARLPAIHRADRPAISELATVLTEAAQSSTRARRLTAGVDRRALDRRARTYRADRDTSRRAAEALKSVVRQLLLLDTVEERSLSLEQAARRPAPDREEIEQAIEALDAAVIEARAAIGKSDWRTRRTHRRGIRRLGGEYLVTTVDGTGIEHVNAFATMREARAFKFAIDASEKQKTLAYSRIFGTGKESAYGYGSGYGDFGGGTGGVDGGFS
jgi:class 3 adenylate cyclase